MFIAIPSFALLYSMDEVVVDPAITIKAIGHQWYRTYEYSDYNSSDEQSLTFDSYTIPEDDLEFGQSRLLEVDNRVVVPAKTHLRIIVTPADVPHSWAVPSSGVKCDAVPGRLNQISISVQREGVYYGQCSEICGTNHAFTPIVVEAVPRKNYGSRVSNQLIPEGTFPLLMASPLEMPLIWCSGGDREPSVDQENLWVEVERRQRDQGPAAPQASLLEKQTEVREKLRDLLRSRTKIEPKFTYVNKLIDDLNINHSNFERLEKLSDAMKAYKDLVGLPNARTAGDKLKMTMKEWDNGESGASTN